MQLVYVFTLGDRSEAKEKKKIELWLVILSYRPGICGEGGCGATSEPRKSRRGARKEEESGHGFQLALPSVPNFLLIPPPTHQAPTHIIRTTQQTWRLLLLGELELP